MADGHKWKKGEPSPNPRGRPRVGDSLATAIREKFPPAKIVEHAEKLLSAESEQVRLSALQMINDRGYGRTPQVVEMSVTNDEDDDSVLDLTGFTPEQIAKLREAAREPQPSVDADDDDA